MEESLGRVARVVQGGHRGGMEGREREGGVGKGEWGKEGREGEGGVGKGGRPVN